MMKKNILIAILIFSLSFAESVVAQQTVQQIAFVNTNELLDAVPEKAAAVESINELNRKYKEELQVMQNDYNKKYTDFISYQTSMAEGVRNRRMQELYELEKAINKFMKVAQDDIEDQEQRLIEPLRKRVRDAIYQVGVEQGFACIYDFANPAVAFVTPTAIDANPFVKLKLGAHLKIDALRGAEVKASTEQGNTEVQENAE